MNTRIILRVTVIIIVTAVSFSGPVSAAELSINCDVVQGFNFSPGQTTPVGHLTYLKIGGTTFASDLDVTDPEDPVGDSMGVAGVMDDIYWAGGPSYPIQFTVRLSTANKNIATVLTHTELASTEVLFRYNAYDYDAGQGRYYKAFHTNSVTLAGYIESSGGDLQIFIDTDQASDVMSPANFAFTLSVMPANVAQVLHRAVSVGSLWTSPWGVAAGNGPDIYTSVTTIDFGTVGAGQTPSRILTVYNDGDSDLIIGTVGLSNPIDAPFLITSDTCTSQAISPGENCAITVTFDEPLMTALMAVTAAGGLGVLVAGLLFTGGPTRRRQMMVLILAISISGMTLISCGGGSSSNEGVTKVEYAGDFDIPSNDPDSATVIVEVVGER